MKKFILICVCLLTIAGNAYAFNPDPARYEYIAQNTDGCGIFYEISTAKADGQKANVVILQADPKNRVLRYYKNTIIDPETMTIQSSYCEIRDYSDTIVLESFNLPNESISYKTDSITDKVYQDMLAKGIVHKPEPVPAPVEAAPAPAPVYVEEPVKGTWREGVTSGEEVIIDLESNADDDVIIDF